MKYLRSALEAVHNLFGRYPLAQWLLVALVALFGANRVLGLVDAGTLAGYLEVAVYALALVAPSVAPNGAPLLAWAGEIVRRAQAEAAGQAPQAGPAWRAPCTLTDEDVRRVEASGPARQPRPLAPEGAPDAANPPRYSS